MKSEKQFEIYGVDIETTEFAENESPKFLFGCVYSEKKQFVFEKVEDFWKFVRTLKSNTVLAFHNLGFDFWFLLPKMPKYKKVQICYLNNPSFVKITKLLNNKRKNIYFKDIANDVGKIPLEQIAKAFCPEYPKLERPENLNMCANNPEAVKYCMRDAEICYRVQKLFYEKFGFGISLPQIAGRWLRKITRINPTGRDDFVKKAERESYFGGLVNIYKFTEKPFEGYKLDINSMYPFCMTNPLPHYFIKRLNKDELKNFKLDYNKQYCYLIKCKVEVKGDFGILPIRLEDGVIYPVGIFEGWFWDHILLFGLKYELIKILKIDEVLVYEKTYSHISEIRQKYQERLNAKTEAEKNLIKLFLNASYGKMAQRKRESISFSVEEFEREFGEFSDSLEYFYDDKLWVVRRYGEIIQLERKTDEEVEGGFTAISSYITSLARLQLFKFLVENPRIYAVDTDCITIRKEDLDLYKQQIGKSLGQLKIEAEGLISLFAPKIYFIWSKDKITRKIKGVPLSKLSQTQLAKMKDDEAVFKYRHLLKPREAEKRKLSPYTLIETEKQIFGFTRFSKGYVYSDGSVKPLVVRANSPLTIYVPNDCINAQFLKTKYKKYLGKQK